MDSVELFTACMVQMETVLQSVNEDVDFWRLKGAQFYGFITRGFVLFILV